MFPLLLTIAALSGLEESINSNHEYVCECLGCPGGLDSCKEAKSVGGKGDSNSEVATRSPDCATACVSCGCSSYAYVYERDPSCFPSDATVELEDGSMHQMHSIKVGDRVRTPTGFSPVFMFTHNDVNVKSRMVQISGTNPEDGASVRVRLSPGHFIFANRELTVARAVTIGDELMLADGGSAVVKNVTTIWSDGLFNPHTLHGEIIVDGVAASCYTDAMAPNLAHTLLWPARMLFSVGVDINSFTAIEKLQ